jgi:hypothetical protein
VVGSDRLEVVVVVRCLLHVLEADGEVKAKEGEVRRFRHPPGKA